MKKRMIIMSIIALLLAGCAGTDSGTDTIENIAVDTEGTLEEETSVDKDITEIDTTIEEKEEDTTAEEVTDNTPYGIHGQLHVEGVTLVDESGEIFQLKGVSTHGIAWFPQYVNEEGFATLSEYGANCIRIAVYSDVNAGYSIDLYSTVEQGVEYATNLGMYVIIDWHILSDGNPNTNKSSATQFFNEMSTRYKDYGNVLYEICNEPNGDVTWSRDIKPYALDMINTIKENDDDAVIIVGTPTWSQDVDVVADDMITGQTNILYALHFYAATHTEDLRTRVQTAIDKGMPIIVSEFGTCDASGNGANNFEQASAWLNMLDDNGIGYVYFNLSNKDESSAMISPSCDKLSGWSLDELSEAGRWYAEWLLKESE